VDVLDALPVGILGALIALLIIFSPGVLFIYALERQVGTRGIKASDRLLRFVVISITLQAIALPFTYLLSRSYWNWRSPIRFIEFNWWFYVGLLGYVGAAAILGMIVGWAARRSYWAHRLFGNEIARTAMDHPLATGRNGYVRMLLRTEPPKWIAGAFVTASDGRRGFMADDSNTSDLYLPVRLACDPDTGAFHLDDSGRAIGETAEILVNRADIIYLEFIEG
jgi:hypothetical protein